MCDSNSSKYSSKIKNVKNAVLQKNRKHENRKKFQDFIYHKKEKKWMNVKGKVENNTSKKDALVNKEEEAP